MTFYLVVWLSLSQACPTGGWILPRIVKSIVCSREDILGYHFTSHRAEARRKIAALEAGTPVLFLRLRGGRAEKIPVSWPRRLEIAE